MGLPVSSELKMSNTDIGAKNDKSSRSEIAYDHS